MGRGRDCVCSAQFPPRIVRETILEFALASLGILEGDCIAGAYGIRKKLAQLSCPDPVASILTFAAARSSLERVSCLDGY